MNCIQPSPKKMLGIAEQKGKHDEFAFIFQKPENAGNMGLKRRYGKTD